MIKTIFLNFENQFRKKCPSSNRIFLHQRFRKSKYKLYLINKLFIIYKNGFRIIFWFFFINKSILLKKNQFALL